MAGGQGKGKAPAGRASRGRGKALTRGGKTNSNIRSLGEAPPQNNTGGAESNEMKEQSISQTWSRLKSLRLYNLRPMNCKSLCDALSVCSSITDLRIIGLYIQSEQLLKTLAAKCRLIEYLFLETYGCQSTLDTKTGRSALVEFVTNCPSLSSLTLIRFGLNSQISRNLAESSRKLKYLNLSRSLTLKGRFLRDLGVSCKDGPLKTLILRNCPSLEEVITISWLLYHKLRYQIF